MYNAVRSFSKSAITFRSFWIRTQTLGRIAVLQRRQVFRHLAIEQFVHTADLDDRDFVRAGMADPKPRPVLRADYRVRIGGSLS